MANTPHNPYDHLYQAFKLQSARAKGYDFQQAPPDSLPPPVLSFPQKLRWWTWDRWRRLKKIRRERDRRVQEILKIKTADPGRSAGTANRPYGDD